MSKLSGVNLHDFGTTYKAYRRELIDQVPLYGEGMHRFIPALASWYGARICEIPIKNINRDKGKSHYGITRTFRVFFDLITIRFLLKYLSRPLHFFGTLGMAGIFGGSAIAVWMMALKVFFHANVMDQHGPLLILAAVMIVAGVQLLAFGLLGELQVRQFQEASAGAPYRVEKVIRAAGSERELQN
jgi:hypothetical protein